MEFQTIKDSVYDMSGVRSESLVKPRSLPEGSRRAYKVIPIHGANTARFVFPMHSLTSNVFTSRHDRSRQRGWLSRMAQCRVLTCGSNVERVVPSIAVAECTLRAWLNTLIHQSQINSIRIHNPLNTTLCGVEFPPKNTP